MRELTRAEEQVMQSLWKIEKGFVKDILDQFSEPKPAYNTVSTIVRILQDKGFIAHKAYGRTHEYFPLVSKDEYSKSHLNSFVKDYFFQFLRENGELFRQGKGNNSKRDGRNYENYGNGSQKT